MRSVRPGVIVWLAIAALAAAGMVGEYLPHNHDGSPVEANCLACRTAVGQTAVATTFTLPSAPTDLVQWLPREARRFLESRQIQTPESRGPPLS